MYNLQPWCTFSRGFNPQVFAALNNAPTNRAKLKVGPRAAWLIPLSQPYLHSNETILSLQEAFLSNLVSISIQKRSSIVRHTVETVPPFMKPHSERYTQRSSQRNRAVVLSYTISKRFQATSSCGFYGQFNGVAQNILKHV